jgi:nucleoside-diphosphate-sugar epimerase
LRERVAGCQIGPSWDTKGAGAPSGGREKAPAGSQLYAATEEGITVREIAETIGRHLNVPAVSIPAEQAADHFKAFPFMTLDITMSNADTRQLLDWEPVHPGLIADLEDGHYFTTD